MATIAVVKTKFNPGQRLMRARQRRRLTRKDAARRLSIRHKDVKLIDQWQLDELPKHVNVQKTVRQYALMTGQNPSDYDGYIPTVQPAAYSQKPIITFSRTTLSFVGLLIGLLAVGFIGWRTFVATASPYLVVEEPADGFISQQPKLVVSGRTSEQAQVIINGINSPVNPDGSFVGEAVLKKGHNMIEIQAVNSFGRESTESRSVFFEP